MTFYFQKNKRSVIVHLLGTEEKEKKHRGLFLNLCGADSFQTKKTIHYGADWIRLR